MLTAQQENQRENGDANRHRYGFSIRLAFAFFLCLTGFQPFPLILLLVKGACRLSEPMDGILLIQSEGPRIGSDKPSGKYLIRQFGKIAFFEGLHKVRADPGLGRHLIERQTFRLPNLSKNSPIDSIVVALWFDAGKKLIRRCGVFPAFVEHGNFRQVSFERRTQDQACNRPARVPN